MNTKLILFIFMLLYSLVSYAQASGGQIRRKPQTTTSVKPSRGNSTRNKPTTPKMSKAEKDRIILNIINNMVYVEGGTFTMGATSEQGGEYYSVEKPTHQVTLSSFSISKYEVTQEEWQAVMGSNPSRFKGAKCPVESVSWNECQEFIRKLNNMTGKRFRLPTEAEWEYAARGGNKSMGYKYSGSNNLDIIGWYRQNSEWITHSVGQKYPNELGLFDMSGNVFEWCQDWNGDYNSNNQTNPTGYSSGPYHVFRGGSWNGEATYSRISSRNGDGMPNSGKWDNSIGLRLAM